MKKWFGSLACLIAVFIGPESSANDTSVGGTGSALLPLVETRVKMVSEDIRMELRPRAQQWRVRAEYRFRNQTGEAVVIQMGFPEHQCDPQEGDCFGDGRFSAMQISVRGKRVEHRVGRVEPGTAWAPSLGRVFVFDVTFAPGEEVQVVHEYRYDRTVGVGYEYVRYLTRTGANWDGAIEEASFTVVLPWRPWHLEHNPAFTLTAFQEEYSKGWRQTQMKFTVQDWIPKDDFWVTASRYLFDVRHPGGQSCGCGVPLEACSDEEMASLVAHLDVEMLPICRNLLYAHHGYVFEEPAYNRTFYPPPTRGSVGLQRNPKFSESLLTPHERRYLRLLRTEERKRRRDGRR